jgi:tRNA A37 threonylcarbamoyladenosine biosynthesis protein TsaE
VIEWGSGFAEGLSESLLEINIERDLETDLRTMTVIGSGRFVNPSEFLGQSK